MKGNEFAVAFEMKNGELSIELDREKFRQAKEAPAAVQRPDSPTIDPFADTEGASPVTVDITIPQISYGGVGTNITANFCGRFIDSPPLFPL